MMIFRLRVVRFALSSRAVDCVVTSFWLFGQNCHVSIVQRAGQPFIPSAAESANQFFLSHFVCVQNSNVFFFFCFSDWTQIARLKTLLLLTSCVEICSLADCAQDDETWKKESDACSSTNGNSVSIFDWRHQQSGIRNLRWTSTRSSNEVEQKKQANYVLLINHSFVFFALVFWWHRQKSDDLWRNDFESVDEEANDCIAS